MGKSGKDWIPIRNLVMISWQEVLIDYWTLNELEWNTPSGRILALITIRNAMVTAWNKIKPTGKGKDSSLVIAFKIAKKAFKKQLRIDYNELLRFNIAISPAERVAAGLPVVTDVMHVKHGAPTSECNVIALQNYKGNQVTFAGNVPHKESGRAGMADDAAIFEVRYKIGGDKPTTISGYDKVKYDTKATINLESSIDLDPIADRGKPVYYIGVWRWGIHYGAWSEPGSTYVP